MNLSRIISRFRHLARQDGDPLGRASEQVIQKDCFDASSASVSDWLTTDALALSERLMRMHIVARCTYDALYRDIFDSGRSLIIGQDEYGPQHKERFWELINASALLLERKRNPVMLEFGTSEFTALYKRLFPNIQLHLSDRPTTPDYPGFTEAVAQSLTEVDAYYALDLEGGAPAIESSSIRPNTYDLILFAEVLEHLDVNPVELLSGLLRLLKPDGFLYLTTPNFFRQENLHKLSRFENPQEVYPPYNGDWDRHHHHREFAAKELVEFVSKADGRVAAFYFSGCWDAMPSLPPHERGNLVLVAMRGND